MYLKWLQDSLQIETRRDSESIFIDIVRHIVLNTRSDPNMLVNIAAVNGVVAAGSNRVIKPISRSSLIKGILSSSSHSVINPLICQALYIDWLFFDQKFLYLYEPGLQLIFNSVDSNPLLTAKLIEFVYQTAKTYDSTRVNKFFLSVQNVLLLAEQREVVPQKVTYLINHPRLHPDIQRQLKELYTADRIINQ